MKLVLIGESPSMPTGFGTQTRLICEGLAARGVEVFLFTASVPMKPIPMRGVTEWRYSNIHDIDLLDGVITTLQPDVCLVFGCTAFCSHFLQLRSTPPNCPTYYWLPYEGSALPKEAKKQFRGTPPNSIIHLSEFARQLWGDVFKSDLVIPHCVDTEIWKYDPDFTQEQQLELRHKWAERLRFPFFDDSFVVLDCDRNIWHKRWDATFDYVAKLQAAMPGRRVQLIAHTRMSQAEEQGHPPGFNLPYLEQAYGLKNQVCYTEFEWEKNLKREELVELFRIADLRITTSQGEGFGVPTIEAAALGKLQIINNQTTMPELVGPDNWMLIEPAMLEDKMGSLWPVPNTQAMVAQTLDFLKRPQTAEKAVEDARLWVEKRFGVGTVVSQLLETFETGIHTNPRTTLQYAYRYGYQKQHDMPKVWGDLARACSKLAMRDLVLEVGSFVGHFVETCTEFGIPIHGIECDNTALGQVPNRARPFITHQEFTVDWPYADLVVCTDMHDRWFVEGGMEHLQNMLERVSYYEWACLRWRPVYRWGQPNVSPIACRSILEAKSMVRRLDLEEKLRLSFPNFEHEVWRRGGDVEFVPEALKDSSNGRSRK